jgi:hypothetical protein
LRQHRAHGLPDKLAHNHLFMTERHLQLAQGVADTTIGLHITTVTAADYVMTVSVHQG